MIRPRSGECERAGCHARRVATRTYRLTVEGELGDYLASAFPGMTLTHGDGTTTLTGQLRDQAELQGALQRVSDLGLTLLETKAVESRPKRPSGHKPVDATRLGAKSPPSRVPQTKGAKP